LRPADFRHFPVFEHVKAAKQEKAAAASLKAGGSDKAWKGIIPAGL